MAGALVADWKEGVTFALGASVTTTKAGSRKSAATKRWRISSRMIMKSAIGVQSRRKSFAFREPVWTMYPAQTARGFWEHQVRWARTIRLVRPASFLGLLFSMVCRSPCSPRRRAGRRIGAAYLLAYLVLRLEWRGSWRVGLAGRRAARKLWLVPLRDLFHFAVWLAASPPIA